MAFWIIMIGTAVMLSRTPAVGQCAGDCSGDGNVTVDELVTGLAIALGNSPLSQCPVFDINGDMVVTVDEIVTVLNNALRGCPASQATPTPTATATPTAGSIIAPNLLGTFSGPGVDTFTGAVRNVRIRIEAAGAGAVVTDLNGNLFIGSSTRTVTALSPTMLFFMSSAGGRVETLQIGPQANGEPTGSYANITTTFPPTGVSVSFVLQRQS
jgi:hypothetical protein